MLIDQSLSERPEVLAALTWLLGPNKFSVRYTLNQAFSSGLLIKLQPDAPWKCNEFKLVHVLERRIRLSGCPYNCSILLGIGELMARCNVPYGRIENKICMVFKSSHLKTAFFDSIKLSLRRGQSDLSDTTVFQPKSVSVYDWEWAKKNFNFDVYSPGAISQSGGFGVYFLTKMILLYAPKDFSKFLKIVDDKEKLQGVIRIIPDICAWHHSAANCAIQSKIPLLALIGISHLIQGWWNGNGYRPADIQRLLEQFNYSEYAKLIISSFVFKQAFHEWYWQKDKPLKNRQHIASLKINPELAPGGEGYAQDRIVQLERLQPDLDRQQQNSDDLLSESFAFFWQGKVPIELAWAQLNWAVLEEPEVIHKAIMACPNAETRHQLHKKFLKHFETKIGAKNPEKSLNKVFETHQFRDNFAHYVAASQVEISKFTDTNVGHDAAKRIVNLERVLSEFASQPLASARFANRFQSALVRWAQLLLFCLCISSSNQYHELKTIRCHTIKSVKKFLPIAFAHMHERQGEQIDRIVELTADIVSALELAIVETWIEDELLPAHLRAQILWSLPTLLNQDFDKAKSLVKEITYFSAPSNSSNWRLNVLLNTFDKSISALLLNDKTEMSNIHKWLLEEIHSQRKNPQIHSFEFEIFDQVLRLDKNAIGRLQADISWQSSRTVNRALEMYDKLKSTPL